MLRNALSNLGIVIFAYCMAMASPSYAQPTGYDGYQVVRITITNEADLKTFQRLQTLGRDFEVWSDLTGKGLMEMRVAPGAKAALAASGLPYAVTIEDLQLYIDEQYRSPRGGGFFDSMQTYDAHVQFMEDLAAEYPDLAEMIVIGYSVLGRPMYALRVTGPGDDKPGVMYHGAQHGNEQAGASLVAYTADHLLTNYDTDPAVAVLVDNVEWFLLPITNPDGYVAFDRWNEHRFDLNRNWGGRGSGQDGMGGPYPFSEPETIAMRDFFLNHPDVRVHVDVHGYVPWIMWPWGHTPDLCLDHGTFSTLGSEIHDLIQTAGGGDYTIGTLWSVAYPVSGGSTNYTYGELGLWAFTFELIHASIPQICEEFLSSMLFLGDWIIDCNGNTIPDADDIATANSADCNANAVPDECESQADCNADGVLDICDFADSSYPDCNGNTIPNACDIESGISEDCTGDGIPDECEPDCNINGVADSCDIAGGTSQDCNSNGIPDTCEPDCNDNGVADSCDIGDGTSIDCDANGIPDDCEPDCNDNGIVDECDIRDGTSQDCNTNSIPDDCEPDCNANSVADECDIADGTSQDANGNGVPDECQFVLFVDADASPGGDGQSWATASRELRDALLAAADGSGFVEALWVANGRYTPALPDGDRAATFQLVSGTGVYGGFAGGETTFNERDPVANVTILSGDLNGNDGNDFANNDENSYHVVSGGVTDPTAVLDGFTITAGNANGSMALDYYGGGMLNAGNCSPTLVNCAFTRNSARNGGGMYNFSNASPTLADCTFIHNEATGVNGGGGGMYNWYDSNPTLTNCLFSSNTANSGGGGMYNFRSDPTLTNSTFSGNSAGYGGGVSNTQNTVTFKNCTFRRNSAINGGGMYGGGTVKLTNCTFTGNTAESNGGAMYNATGSQELVNCAFSGNTADGLGGAMYSDRTRPTLISCAFSGNIAGVDGGGIYKASYYENTPILVNCILWNNQDSGGVDQSAQLHGGRIPAIDYSCIQGWTGALGGVGNIGDDPLFGDPDGPDGIPGTEDDSLRLSPESPCINTGDPAYVLEPGASDLDGYPRVLCARVDMGPYEFGIGDYDCNQLVNLTDFTAWIACVTGPHGGPYDAGCEAFDFNADDHIDLADFTGVQNAHTVLP